MANLFPNNPCQCCALCIVAGVFKAMKNLKERRRNAEKKLLLASLREKISGSGRKAATKLTEEETILRAAELVQFLDRSSKRY